MLIGFVAASAIISLDMLVLPIFGGYWRPDFTPMWVSVRVPDPYDIWAITKAQAFMFNAIHPLPFLYPPSSLPIFFPFGLLPFWWAYALWTALSVALFWSAARQITDRAWLAFIAPPVVFSIYLGQTALMTGAAIMFAVVHLPKRPLLAGLCFGIAGALKPQAVLVVPIVLISGRHWKAFGAAAFAWALFAVPTIRMWPDWSEVVRAFPAILDHYYPKIAVGYSAAPAYFAKAAGLPPLPFQIAGIVLGVVLALAAFRTDDIRVRIVGLVTGSLLVAPYAMGYEMAAMVPAYLSLLREGRARSVVVALPAFCITVLALVPALVVSGVALLWSPHGNRRETVP